MTPPTCKKGGEKGSQGAWEGQKEELVAGPTSSPLALPPDLQPHSVS
jgi:hypothetical protein